MLAAAAPSRHRSPAGPKGSVSSCPADQTPGRTRQLPHRFPTKSTAEGPSSCVQPAGCGCDPPPGRSAERLHLGGHPPRHHRSRAEQGALLLSHSDHLSRHWRRSHHRHRQRVPSPLPARDHPARGLALLPVRPELSRCRGPARRARHRRLLRDGAPVGAQVRPRLCRTDSTAPATAFGPLASGRGLHPDRRQDPLSLARRRRRGRSSRHHRAAAA